MRPNKSRSSAAAANLAALRDDPVRQAEAALELLDPKNGLEAVRAALSVLAHHPLEQARPRLSALYEHYAANNGVRDVGAYTRTAILHALRPVLRPVDTALLVSAVTTYEFPPPEHAEEAGILRGSAVALLSQVDEQLAHFFATRLLADGYTERMSGEPALTAVRTLTALGEDLPLYFYAVQDAEQSPPEVVAECLRNLTGVPLPVVDELVKQYGAGRNLPALVGLFELLLEHQSGPCRLDFLGDFLRTTRDLDLYRYLATLMATSPSREVRSALVQAVRDERGADKQAVIQEVMDLAPEQSEFAELRKERLPPQQGARSRPR